MMRTQIYLPKILHQQLGIVAQKEKKTKAQVIRERLVQALQKEDQGTLGEGLERLASLGKKLKLKAPSDLSANFDKYLYENE